MTVANNTTTFKIPHFKVNDKNGRYVARHSLTDDQIIKAAKAILVKQFNRIDVFTHAETVKNYLIAHYSKRHNEVFICLFCDNKYRLMSNEILFTGTINRASVYPREVVKRALELNAVAVIFAHNHPSGLPEPSEADIRITEVLQVALNTVDVRVLDHIIVGGGEAVSFADLGYMNCPRNDV